MARHGAGGRSDTRFYEAEGIGKEHVSGAAGGAARSKNSAGCSPVPTIPFFFSRHRKPYTRFGVYSVVARVPTLAARRVVPHVLGNTAAGHLVKVGIDINTTRPWLGPACLETTVPNGGRSKPSRVAVIGSTWAALSPQSASAARRVG